MTTPKKTPAKRSAKAASKPADKPKAPAEQAAPPVPGAEQQGPVSLNPRVPADAARIISGVRGRLVLQPGERGLPSLAEVSAIDLCLATLCSHAMADQEG